LEIFPLKISNFSIFSLLVICTAGQKYARFGGTSLPHWQFYLLLLIFFPSYRVCTARIIHFTKTHFIQMPLLLGFCKSRWDPTPSLVKPYISKKWGGILSNWVVRASFGRFWDHILWWQLRYQVSLLRVRKIFLQNQIPGYFYPVVSKKSLWVRSKNIQVRAISASYLLQVKSTLRSGVTAHLQ